MWHSVMKDTPCVCLQYKKINGTQTNYPFTFMERPFNFRLMRMGRDVCFCCAVVRFQRKKVKKMQVIYNLTLQCSTRNFCKIKKEKTNFSRRKISIFSYFILREKTFGTRRKYTLPCQLHWFSYCPVIFVFSFNWKYYFDWLFEILCCTIFCRVVIVSIDVCND